MSGLTKTSLQKSDKSNEKYLERIINVVKKQV